MFVSVVTNVLTIEHKPFITEVHVLRPKFVVKLGVMNAICLIVDMHALK